MASEGCVQFNEACNESIGASLESEEHVKIFTFVKMAPTRCITQTYTVMGVKVMNAFKRANIFVLEAEVHFVR